MKRKGMDKTSMRHCKPKGKKQQTSKPGDMLNIEGKEERSKISKIISKF